MSQISAHPRELKQSCLTTPLRRSRSVAHGLIIKNFFNDSSTILQPFFNDSSTVFSMIFNDFTALLEKLLQRLCSYYLIFFNDLQSFFKDFQRFCDDSLMIFKQFFNGYSRILHIAASFVGIKIMWVNSKLNKINP